MEVHYTYLIDLSPPPNKTIILTWYILYWQFYVQEYNLLSQLILHEMENDSKEVIKTSFFFYLLTFLTFWTLNYAHSAPYDQLI